MNLMKQKILAISLALIAFSSLTLTVAAEKGSEMNADLHAKMGLSGTHNDLNLTADQREKFKAWKLGAEKQNIQNVADMKMVCVDFKTEAMKDNPDMAKVERLIQRMGEQHGKMMLAHTQKMIFFRSLLTSDQKKTLDQMHAKAGDEMCGGRKCMGMKHGCNSESWDKDRDWE